MMKTNPYNYKKCFKQNPIPIYGDGKNIRDWLYVLDHCKGIDLVYHNGKLEKHIILVEEMKEQIFK